MRQSQWLPHPRNRTGVGGGGVGGWKAFSVLALLTYSERAGCRHSPFTELSGFVPHVRYVFNLVVYIMVDGVYSSEVSER